VPLPNEATPAQDSPYYDYESPCVRTCVIDQQSKFCIGCGRTLHEISYWTRYTRDERRQILLQLSARLSHASRN
jgi:predicted Fe-S protein YdhL (DUF1289 family)